MGCEEREMAGQVVMVVIQPEVTIWALFRGLIKIDNQVMSLLISYCPVSVTPGKHTQFWKWTVNICILYHTD